MNKINITFTLFLCSFAVNIFSQQPVLNYPEHGSIINTLTPTLQWGGIGGNHTRVRVQVDTNYSFFFPTVIDVELPQFTTSYSVPSGRLQYNKVYYWRVGAYYYPGYYSYSNIFSFSTSITGINIISNNIPDNFSLSQNYPNPFNPSTKIKFDIPLSRGVDAGGGRGVFNKLSVYDILGREVATLVNQQLQPGTYEVDWDATAYPSGVYFYSISSGDYKETKKMLILK